MKYLNEAIMRFIASIVLTLLLMTSCSWLNSKLGLEPDNKYEEFIEDVIEMKTGVPIDLTHESPESDE